MPSSRSSLAVPPVDTISTPSSDSPRAKSTRPRLSDTDSSARRTFTSPGATGSAPPLVSLAILDLKHPGVARDRDGPAPRRSGVRHAATAGAPPRERAPRPRRSREDRGEARNDSCKTIGPLSTPSSTRWTVTPMTFTPCSSACSIAPTAGEGREERGMHVQDPAREAPDELRAEQLHEAGEHHQVHGQPVEPVPQRLVARAAVGVVGDREHRGVHPGAAGALEPARLGAARRHAHHLDRSRSAGQLASVDAVEQRLEVRSLAGDEYGDAERHGQAVACAGIRRTG